MICPNCKTTIRDDIAICPICNQSISSYTPIEERLFEKGIELEKEGQYSEACKYYQQAADRNVPYAAYSVCRCLEKTNGDHYRPDYYEFWLETASLNDQVAAYAFAQYLKRLGDSKNYYAMLHHSADLGNEKALMEIISYEYKKKNKNEAKYYAQQLKDPKQVKKWYRKLKSSIPEKTTPYLPSSIPAQKWLYFGDYAMTQELPHIAFTFYELGSSVGDVACLEKTIQCYKDGKGVKKDSIQLVQLIEQLAKLGKYDQLVYLGDCFLNGDVVGIVDQEKAFSYYNQAQEQSVVGACERMGKCYRYGIACSQSYAKSIFYYTKAKDLGSVLAIEALNEMMKEAQKLYTNALEEKRQGNDILYFCTLQKSTQYKYLPAIIELGTAYKYGIGTSKDFSAARNCYLLGVKENNPYAHFLLGISYIDNLLYRTDYKKAKMYLQKAFELGVIEAKDYLEKIEIRYKKKLAQKAYSFGCIAYFQGRKNDAAKLFIAASKMNQLKALFFLGCMYDYGDGIQKDYQKSSLIFEQARQRGFDGKRNGFYDQYLKRKK